MNLGSNYYDNLAACLAVAKPKPVAPGLDKRIATACEGATLEGYVRQCKEDTDTLYDLGGGLHWLLFNEPMETIETNTDPVANEKVG
jgi:hypothetical protein